MVTLRRSLIALAILLLPTLFLGFALAAASAARPALEGRPLVALAQEDLGISDLGSLGPSFQPRDGVAGVTDEPSTTLTLTILSSPWATVDSNDPGGVDGPVPDVFVVQGLITNTGPVTATDVTITLDYDRGEASGWVLADGENAERGMVALGPGASGHVYWLARYPATTQIVTQRYTVTAVADNAPPVSTSDNAYGNPAPGATVQTVHALSTGNSGIVSHVSGNVVVGVPFTVSVLYDLGSNPDNVAFSPVGNPDFAAGAFRLVGSSVRLFDDPGTHEEMFPDQLYFPTLPALADNAEVTYTFLVMRSEETRLCSYADVGFKSNYKYDQFYCEGGRIVPVTGTLEIELDKQATLATIQQGETLTYTIRYTNTGEWTMTRVWIWDDLDPAVGSIITSSISPPGYDPDELQNNRLAWYLGDLPVGAEGTLTYAIQVDGGGEDLPDGLVIVNHAFQGIGANLPLEPALTATVTTTVQAPALSVSKTDGRTQVDVGEFLTYTLIITNDGSTAAVGPMITDLLPAYVVPAGPTNPITDSQDGGMLIWSSLGPIPPQGGGLSITIPCRVLWQVPDGTVLMNQMIMAYRNSVGHGFRPEEAYDTTIVRSPVLEIAKDAAPDPVENGASLTFTLVYSNSGHADATGVVVSDRVPISTTFMSCAGGQSCQESGGVVTWLVGTVPSQTADLELELVVHTDRGLHTGDVVVNDDYGIAGDQTPYLAGPPVTVGVVRPVAVIDGHTFVDADGDGVRDVGEAGIPGITVTLPLALEPITLTDGDGHFAFCVEITSPVSVTASLPDGYFRTTPGLVWLEPILHMTQTVDFGYAPAASLYGVIYGTVFDDVDTDGQRDSGEAGLAAVTITSSEAVTPTVTTNQWGQYTLRFSASGPVTITETNPPLYISTTPDQISTVAVVGSSGPSPVDFGDVLAPGCGCPPDGYEEDDTWEGAAALTPGGMQLHDFCDDAVDWVAFEAQAGAVYTLTTSSWGRRADTFLSLFDTDGETLLAANDDYQGAGDYSSQIVWQAPAGGTYYVRTTNRASLDGCLTEYDLWLEEREEYRIYLPVTLRNHGSEGRAAQLPAAPEGLISHSCPDDYEVDDTWETARPLVDGMLQVHSFDSDPWLYAADKDWLGFDLRAHQAVTLTIVEVTNTVTLLELFDGQGGLLAQTEAAQLTWEALADGHYFVAVSPLTTTFGCAGSVGYQLVGAVEPLHQLFLPILMR
jgi:uncharacterized repeat protein (TIGR01451 family)